MAGLWVPFLIALGVASAIFCWLQNRQAGRRWSSDTAGGDVGYSSDTGSSTWSFTEWFTSSSPSDGSGNPSDGGSSGSWDNCGSDSGDSGGGDSGGGGGSD
jgi:hypothetical protein